MSAARHPGAAGLYGGVTVPSVLDTIPEPPARLTRPAPLRSFRSIELPPPPAFTSRPFTAPAPRAAPPVHPVLYQPVPTAPIARPITAPVTAEPASTPTTSAPPTVAAPLPLEPDLADDARRHTPIATRSVAAPVQVRASLTRRDGALGFAVAMLVMMVVLAAALAMQRSMHGWPPGSF